MSESHILGVQDKMKALCGYTDTEDFHGAYKAIAEAVGIGNLTRYIPENGADADNIPADEWEYRANLIAPLLYETTGINWSTLKQRVSILKEAAVLNAKEA